jgi:tRNA threonylcarbamoyladenosine biosynthesis protein TsaE
LDRLELDISDLSQLSDAAKKVLEFAGNLKVFAFEAGMGAGKTTFIKQLCSALGSQDSFSSPTYAIVNEYNSPRGKIYHFDLYRIKNQEELLDLGFEEYLSSGNFCFIEWPDLAGPFFPKSFVGIKILLVDGRKLLVEKLIFG